MNQRYQQNVKNEERSHYIKDVLLSRCVADTSVHLNAYQPARTLSEILINVSMSGGFTEFHKLLSCFVSTVRVIPRVLILSLTATGTFYFMYHSASRVFSSFFFFFLYTKSLRRCVDTRQGCMTESLK